MTQEELNDALRDACRDGDLKEAEEYIEKGAYIDTKDCWGRTPLNIAAYSGHTGITKILLEAGANIEATNRNGRTPLHLAAYKGQIEVVKLLLEAGANPKALDEDGQTPISLNRTNVNPFTMAATIEVIKTWELLKEAMKETA